MVLRTAQHPGINGEVGVAQLDGGVVGHHHELVRAVKAETVQDLLTEDRHRSVDVRPVGCARDEVARDGPHRLVERKPQHHVERRFLAGTARQHHHLELAAIGAGADAHDATNHAVGPQREG